MALTIKWSRKAEKKFDSILDYLNDEFGEITTAKFVKKVFDFLTILGEFPEIGSLENKEYGIRGFVIVKQITLFYQIRDSTIILLNFYDNRQHPKKAKF